MNHAEKYNYPLPAYAISLSEAYDTVLRASGCKSEAKLDLATFDERLVAVDFRFRKALYRAELMAFVLDDENDPCPLRAELWSTALPEGNTAEIFLEGIDFVGPALPQFGPPTQCPGKYPTRHRRVFLFRAAFERWLSYGAPQTTEASASPLALALAEEKLSLLPDKREASAPVIRLPEQEPIRDESAAAHKALNFCFPDGVPSNLRSSALLRLVNDWISKQPRGLVPPNKVSIEVINRLLRRRR
jgi:hypothetical protein